jgi:hypothetical protein
MATLVTYATQDAQLSSFDAAWDAAREFGAIGTTAIDSSSATAKVGVQLVAGTYTCFQFAMRFDTSSIGTASVKDAKCSIFGSSNANTSGWFLELGHSKNFSTPNIVAGDFGVQAEIQLDTVWGTVVVALSTGAYTEFGVFGDVAKANRVATVVGSGNTDLLAFDVDEEVGTPVPTGVNTVTVFTVDQAGTTNDPKLTVVYGLFVRSTGVVGTAASGNLALTYPTTVVTGDRFVAVITSGDNIASTRAGWTLKQGTNNGSGLRTEIWYKDAASDGTETGTVTWTRTSGLGAVGRIFAITGAASSGDPIEAIGNSANSASTTVTQPTVATLSNGALVMEVASLAGIGTTSAYSGTDPTFVEEADDSFEPRPTYLIATGNNNGGGGTSITGVAPGAGAAIGDLVVLAVYADGTGSTITPGTGGNVTSWATQESKADASGILKVFTGTLTSASSAIGNITTSNVKASYALIVVKNCNTTTPNNIDGSQANASSTSCVAPTVTPSAANTILLWVGGTHVDTTLSTLTGFTIPGSGKNSGNNFGATSGGAAGTRTTVSLGYILYPTSGGATGAKTGVFANAAVNVGYMIAVAALSPTSTPISQAVADDNKTTAGSMSSLTATASASLVNTGVLLSIPPLSTAGVPDELLAWMGYPQFPDASVVSMFQ